MPNPFLREQSLRLCQNASFGSKPAAKTWLAQDLQLNDTSPAEVNLRISKRSTLKTGVGINRLALELLL
jgi:hypothetical protein